MKKKIIICGVGNQGVVTFSKILLSYLSKAKISASSYIKSGLGYLGGSVSVFISIGDEFPFFSEGEVDYLIGFELIECGRFLNFLKNTSIAIVYLKLIKTYKMKIKKEREIRKDEIISLLEKRVKKLITVTSEELKENKIPERLVNSYLLGILASELSLDLSLMINELKNHVKFHKDLNKKALLLGYKKIQKGVDLYEN